MEVILVILLFYILILFNKKDVYEYFHPNENQYSLCSSPNSDEKGETTIGIKENKIPIPQKGMFTSLIEHTNEKNYSTYFKTPKCSLIPETSIHNYYGKKIIDANENIIPPSIDPSQDKYQHPHDNYSVLYPPIFNDKFVDQHRMMIENDGRF